MPPRSRLTFACQRRLRPDEAGVEFVGEIDEQQKAEFLGNAAALLFPIDRPEPFGVVMIEFTAAACRSPPFSSASSEERPRSKNDHARYLEI